MRSRISPQKAHGPALAANLYIFNCWRRKSGEFGLQARVIEHAAVQVQGPTSCSPLGQPAPLQLSEKPGLALNLSSVAPGWAEQVQPMPFNGWNRVCRLAPCEHCLQGASLHQHP